MKTKPTQTIERIAYNWVKSKFVVFIASKTINAYHSSIFLSYSHTNGTWKQSTRQPHEVAKNSSLLFRPVNVATNTAYHSKILQFMHRSGSGKCTLKPKESTFSCVQQMLSKFYSCSDLFEMLLR